MESFAKKSNLNFFSLLKSVLKLGIQKLGILDTCNFIINGMSKVESNPNFFRIFFQCDSIFSSLPYTFLRFSTSAFYWEAIISRVHAQLFCQLFRLFLKREYKQNIFSFLSFLSLFYESTWLHKKVF